MVRRAEDSIWLDPRTLLEGDEAELIEALESTRRN
jgi:hypothetical protein